MTSASPGSPTEKAEKVPIDASATSIARRRIGDPRSISGIALACLRLFTDFIFTVIFHIL